MRRKFTFAPLPPPTNYFFRRFKSHSNRKFCIFTHTNTSSGAIHAANCTHFALLMLLENQEQELKKIQHQKCTSVGATNLFKAKNKKFEDWWWTEFSDSYVTCELRDLGPHRESTLLSKVFHRSMFSSEKQNFFLETKKLSAQKWTKVRVGKVRAIF